eukprot:TRINITY_DN907_c1_g1_i1.p1 TRINITY_DN907_c1_g1~~TRINITY_DN907_c1_g1_i1.p1  ORF type:complete len:166 (+),score=40.17 TRINITY_DN907_c1_g1_i1:50-547(+)
MDEEFACFRGRRSAPASAADASASCSLDGGVAAKRARAAADEQLQALERAAFERRSAGDLHRARELYEEALRRSQVRAAAPGAVCEEEMVRVQAEILSELGATCAASGDVVAARAHSEGACRLLSRLLPEDHPVLQRLVGRLYALAAVTGGAELCRGGAGASNGS